MVDWVPIVNLPLVAYQLKALAFAKHGIIKKITRLWPSPNAMDLWMKKIGWQ
jgi:hypothetical protein